MIAVQPAPLTCQSFTLIEEDCMPPGRPRKNDDVLMKSAEMIGWAIGGLEREISQTRERLTALTAQAAKLRKRAGIRGSAAATETPGPRAVGSVEGGGKRKRRKMSPEARKRISEMMKKRWAERRKGR
jgi:hypothetical protein